MHKNELVGDGVFDIPFYHVLCRFCGASRTPPPTSTEQMVIMSTKKFVMHPSSPVTAYNNT